MTSSRLLSALQDRSLSGTVWKVVTCPRMGLIAAVLDRNSVAIFRINWQRLTTIPVCTAQNEVITAVAWSPDGAKIAVGTSSCIISIYSVDRCASTPSLRAKRGSRETEAIVTKALLSSPTTIVWSEPPSRSPRNGENKDSSVYKRRAASIHDIKWKEDDEGCNGLLLVGDANGIVTVLSHNLQLSVARVRAAPDGLAVDHIHLSGCKRYWITGGSNEDSECVGNHKSDSEERRVFKAFDLTKMLDFWPEINRVGSEILSFHRIVSMLSATVKKVREHWIEGAEIVLESTIRAPLDTLLTQHAEEGVHAWQALHGVYCGARVEGAVLQFLANNLSENGAKEALRSFRSYADDTEEAMLSLIPAAQHAVFSASEYRGLSRLESRFGPAGVVFSLADGLLKHFETVLWALGDLVDDIEQAAQESEAFLAWMVTACTRAGGESVQMRGSGIPDNVTGRDADLISQFFERRTGATLPQKEPRSELKIAKLLSDHIQPSLDKVRTVLNDITAMPCERISSWLDPSDEITYVKRKKNTVREVYSLCEGQSAANPDQEAGIIAVFDDGSFARIRFNFLKAEWIVQRYTMASLDLKIHCALMFKRNAILMITSNLSSNTAGGRTGYQVSLYSSDTDGDCMDTTLANGQAGLANGQVADGVHTMVSVAQDFTGELLDSKSCGIFEEAADPAVSINSQLGLISILIAPRKILLFRTSYGDSDEETMDV